MQDDGFYKWSLKTWAIVAFLFIIGGFILDPILGFVIMIGAIYLLTKVGIEDD